MKSLIDDEEFMRGYNDWVFQECEEWKKKQMLYSCPHCGTKYKNDRDMMCCPCLFEEDTWIC